MTTFFFIIIKTFSTIAIKQTPCQIQMEFAPLWHKRGQFLENGIGWCGFQMNVKRKVITFGWPTITIHLHGNVSSFSFLFDFFSSFVPIMFSHSFFPILFSLVIHLSSYFLLFLVFFSLIVLFVVFSSFCALKFQCNLCVLAPLKV
jgi:hypothetical protein